MCLFLSRQQGSLLHFDMLRHVTFGYHIGSIQWRLMGVLRDALKSMLGSRQVLLCFVVFSLLSGLSFWTCGLWNFVPLPPSGDLRCGLSIVDMHAFRALWAPWSCLDFVRRHRVCQLNLRYDQPQIFASSGKESMLIEALACCFSMFEFDATLGFPGEGPNLVNSDWSITSYNVGSLKANLEWKTLNDNVLALQETRIGKNNHRTSSNAVLQTNRTLFPGALLTGLITENGVQRTPHGGTAILGPQELCQPFHKDHDLTSKYDQLFSSKRCNATWVQVTHEIKILVFCFYGQSGASTDKSIHESNNALLETIFEISAQFGEIPILITGDFQDIPFHYEAVAHAINFDGWNDPLTSIDSDGQWHRDHTFSRDGSFTGDFCTSIDAILLNRVSLVALKSIEILQWTNTQHRPIRATFHWKTIFLHGAAHQKNAALCLDEICEKAKREDIADQLWESSWSSKFNHASNSNEKWNIANDFCLEVLLKSGAKWEAGKRTRTSIPAFKQKQHCPGQTRSFGATNRKFSLLANLLARLKELRIRLERPQGSNIDVEITRKLSCRTWRALREIHAPFIWLIPPYSDLTCVSSAIVWTKDMLHAHELDTKKTRIALWKTKMQLSCQSTKAFLFAHLKNKIRDEPANLVTDEKDNIIFQPDLAIHEINSRWDDIFAANILKNDPVHALAIVWPFIKDTYSQCHIDPITPHLLHQSIQKRAALAAPGLEGWRTREVQALPINALKPIAAFFQSMEENSDPLPESLVRAKQMILNKGTSSDPLNKRLITLLPVFLLAYSGSRYRQLADWQQSIMPPSIVGAIPKRNMSSIQVDIRSTLDQAHVDSIPMVGIKIDKSKAFDRIIPSFAATLMLSFGIPKFVVAMFLKQYQGLKRHLSYRGWMTKTFTTACNGVAQGCSMSLIAINMYNLVFSCLIANVTQITMKAFIDDAYLWSSLANLAELQHVMKISEAWDSVSGQDLNAFKCVIWGTTTEARSAIAEAFPLMKLQYAFDCLGAQIYTCTNCGYGFPPQKVAKICTDAKNIAMLPFALKPKVSITSMKIIPQCSFAAQFSKMTVKDLGRIQNEVASIFWFRKPHWRSKWLLFTFLAPPHLTEPICARAYGTIRDSVRVCVQNPSILQLLTNHAPIEMPSISMITILRNAFQCFQMTLDDHLFLRFADRYLCKFADLQPADIKHVIPHLARQTCYEAAAKKPRKDFYKPRGLVDFDLTMCFPNKLKNTENTLPDRVFFESQIVGCGLTRDRLLHANLAESSLCRFCGIQKENLPHLLACPVVTNAIGVLPEHELGANFLNLGIIEHPRALLCHRLKISDPADLIVSPFNCNAVPISLWTDGSLMWSSSFWLTTATFAVINEAGNVVKVGQVHAWLLASYSCELWAILEAVAFSAGPVCIYTDCKTVVQQFQQMTRTLAIPIEWKHRSWWLFLLDVWILRCRTAHEPISLRWIPAHKLGGIPIPLITEDMAKANGSTPLHIKNNRLADAAAKREAEAKAPIRPGFQEELQDHIRARQEWLIKLNKRLAQDNPNIQSGFQKRVVCPVEHEQFTIEIAKQKFHMWPWSEPATAFRWKAKIPDECKVPAKCKLSQADWTVFCQFMASLRWKTGGEETVAYMQITAMFVFKGFAFSFFDKDTTTFKEVNSTLRKCLTFASRINNSSFFPGEGHHDQKKISGRSFPAGIIKGGRVWWQSDELFRLASIFDRGAGARLNSWNILISE